MKKLLLILSILGSIQSISEAMQPVSAFIQCHHSRSAGDKVCLDINNNPVFMGSGSLELNPQEEWRVHHQHDENGQNQKCKNNDQNLPDCNKYWYDRTKNHYGVNYAKLTQELRILNPSNAPIQSAYTSLDELIQDFSKLPKNRQGATYKDSGFAIKFPDKQDQIRVFKHEIERWMKMRSEMLNQDSDWAKSNLNTTKPKAQFYNYLQPMSIAGTKYVEFIPFVEKIENASDQRFIMRGDLHGDIASLVTQLKDMKQQNLIDDNFKLAPNFNMAFLGDYVDRGKFGLEVLYVLALLGNANPKNVFFVRGNHEDMSVNKFSFVHEVKHKFNDIDGSLHKWLSHMYDYMPVAIYLGDGTKRYVQLCHGGLEQGYQPEKLLTSDKKYQLLGALHRAKAVKELKTDKEISSDIKDSLQKITFQMKDNLVLNRPSDSDLPLGFMWNDFDPTGKGPAVTFKRGRGLEYGQAGVDAVLNKQAGSSQVNIMGVIRAHQHTANSKDTMMQKIAQGGGVCNMRGCDHGQGIGNGGKHKDVYTLNVGPDSVYGRNIGFEDDTSITVHPTQTGPWKFYVHKHYPFKK